MLFDVSENLFRALAAHEHARANALREDEVEEPNVWLHTDLGPSFYLTRSGRILVTDAFEADTPPREATVDEASAAVVLGARNLGAPQLLRLLPPRSIGALQCTRCDGSRWATLEARDVKGNEVTIICPVCSGKGWTG
jgi:hypothetical protein